MSSRGEEVNPSFDPEALRRMGFGVLAKWDHQTARDHAADGWAKLRREQPKLAREFRLLAFDARAELAEELADVPQEHVERVTLAVMGRLIALQISLGLDPKMVGVAGTVFALAVMEDQWPPKP